MAPFCVECVPALSLGLASPLLNDCPEVLQGEDILIVVPVLLFEPLVEHVWTLLIHFIVGSRAWRVRVPQELADLVFTIIPLSLVKAKTPEHTILILFVAVAHPLPPAGRKYVRRFGPAPLNIGLVKLAAVVRISSDAPDLFEELGDMLGRLGGLGVLGLIVGELNEVVGVFAWHHRRKL